MTSDTKAAGKFYSDVVGWTTQEMPGTPGMDSVPYTTFNLGASGHGRDVAPRRSHCLDRLHLR